MHGAFNCNRRAATELLCCRALSQLQSAATEQLDGLGVFNCMSSNKKSGVFVFGYALVLFRDLGGRFAL